MRKVLLIVTLLCGFLHTAEAQHFAIKTNSLYWAVLAPNVDFEFGVGPKMTMDLSGAYKPWNLRNDNNARLWYKQRPNLPCAKCFSNKTENYFGPTKLGLTVTYLF